MYFLFFFRFQWRQFYRTRRFARLYEGNTTIINSFVGLSIFLVDFHQTPLFFLQLLILNTRYSDFECLRSNWYLTLLNYLTVKRIFLSVIQNVRRNSNVKSQTDKILFQHNKIFNSYKTWTLTISQPEKNQFVDMVKTGHC